MFDAFLLLSFGGPEGPEDVMPFLRNVTRGREVSAARLAEVAEHYYHFGGVSPMNEQNRMLLRALTAEFTANDVKLPIYWGNRNWHPMLTDTVRQMRADGVRDAIAFVTSAYSSYSSCRQYLEDIATARAQVGSGAPVITKIPPYYWHPGFIDAHVAAVKQALSAVPATSAQNTRLVFTAHSIPVAMNQASGGTYQTQLLATARAVAEQAAPHLGWDLVWQSRSGAAQTPWLEPDINDHLIALAKQGITSTVVSPIGFVSDHLEVRWDLDIAAAQTARDYGLAFVRVATPGVHPRFVTMIRELVTAHATGASTVTSCGTATCCQVRESPRVAH